MIDLDTLQLQKLNGKYTEFPWPLFFPSLVPVILCHCLHSYLGESHTSDRSQFSSRGPIYPWDSCLKAPYTLGFSYYIARLPLVTLTATQKSPTWQLWGHKDALCLLQPPSPLKKTRGRSCADCRACVKLLINCSLITACSRGFNKSKSQLVACYFRNNYW